MEIAPFLFFRTPNLLSITDIQGGIIFDYVVLASLLYSFILHTHLLQDQQDRQYPLV